MLAQFNIKNQRGIDMLSVAWKKGLVYILAGFLCGSAMAIDNETQGDAVACVIGEGRWGGGPPNDAERWSDLSDDLLLVGAGAELVVFDISTPTLPVELGRAMVNHPASNVAVSDDGSMVALSDNFDNMTLVDISNRTTPTVRGSYAWAGIQQPNGMAFDGDYLYVAVRTVGMSVLDISDPDAPTFVANTSGSVTDFVFDVAVRGDYAYLGQNADGIQIVDISDPNTPTIVGNHAASTGAGQIKIEGSLAYVARGNNGFAILDLTNPVAPSVTGGLNTTGFTFEVVLLSGDRVATADATNGTVIYDISTPNAPVELGNDSQNPFRLVPLGSEIFVVYGANYTPRIRLLDFQTPATPSEIGHIDFDGQSRDVSVGNGHVLVANSNGDVVMLDTSNPVTPSEIGRLDVGFTPGKVGHINGYGIASTSYNKEMAIIDPQPGGPILVTNFDGVGQSNDLVDDGTRLYVASGTFGGLRIYDMSNPPTPVFLGSLVPASEVVWQVAASGNYAYSGYVNSTNLLVIDVSDPTTPVTVGSPYVLPGVVHGSGPYGTRDMAVSGNTVFVATTLDGVRILQNDGAGNLSEIADIDVLPAIAEGVSIDGDFLYISAGVFSGLLVYDVSDPANPQFVEQHNTAGEGEAVDAAGGVIAMAEGTSGVSTLGCDLAASNQPPVTVGEIADQSTDEGVTIFPLSTNPNFSDPDGQALAFTAIGLPPGLDISVGSGVVEGDIACVSAGVYDVEITATDPFGLFVTQSFTWTIVETNCTPVVLSGIGDQSNDEGDSVNLDISTHFSDPDGDTLRFEEGNLPNGLSMDESSGVISGILAGDSSGVYPVLILAYDPDDESITQTITWTVTNLLNAPPVVESNIANQTNDEYESVNLDVSTNFSDPDGDTLRFEASNLPNGVSIDGPSGVISGELAGDSSGNYTTIVKALDPDDEMVSQSFSWIVANVNKAPIVNGNIADQTNAEGDNISLDISTFFSDPDGDTLRFEASNLPAGLDIDGPTGVISGVLTGDSSGVYTTQIRAYDQDDAMISQTFSWTVSDTAAIIFLDSFE